MARPVRTFAGFVGQRRVARMLEQLADRSRARNIPARHLLFSGRPGMGKTELARAFAAALGNFTPDQKLTNLHEVSGGRHGRDHLHAVLHRIAHGDVLFIDEAHGINDASAEMLFTAISDGKMFAFDEHGKIDVGRLEPLAAFTLILATNRVARLPKALRSRVNLVELDAYTPRELKAIAERSATSSGLDLTGQAANALVARTDRTPRGIENAVALLSSLHQGHTTKERVSSLLMLALGVDENGLSPLQRELLMLLHRGGPLRHEHLALELGLESDHVRTELEGPLLRGRFIMMRGAARARELTDVGRTAIAPYLDESDLDSEANPATDREEEDEAPANRVEDRAANTDDGGVHENAGSDGGGDGAGTGPT